MSASTASRPARRWQRFFGNGSCPELGLPARGGKHSHVRSALRLHPFEALAVVAAALLDPAQATVGVRRLVGMILIQAGVPARGARLLLRIFGRGPVREHGGRSSLRRRRRSGGLARLRSRSRHVGRWWCRRGCRYGGRRRAPGPAPPDPRRRVAAASRAMATSRRQEIGMAAPRYELATVQHAARPLRKPEQHENTFFRYSHAARKNKELERMGDPTITHPALGCS